MDAPEAVDFHDKARDRPVAGSKTRSDASGPKACKFCGIGAGTAKSFTVFRDAVALAFLDYRPLMIGHVLLVPVEHYETLADLPDAVMGALAIRAKLISAAVMRGLAAEGSFIALNNIVSQSVPHVHFHIVPRNKGDGLFTAGYIWKRVAYRDDAMREETAAKIRAALESLT
jgi:histidine triad (HIT) family protein